jgi:hypothetical protein
MRVRGKWSGTYEPSKTAQGKASSVVAVVSTRWPGSRVPGERGNTCCDQLTHRDELTLNFQLATEYHLELPMSPVTPPEPEYYA